MRGVLVDTSVKVDLRVFVPSQIQIAEKKFAFFSHNHDN
jgi:hypothetical protein